MEPQQQENLTLQIKVLTYNTLVEKSTYTPNVKNDGSWRNYSWQSRRQQLILKIVTQSADIICLQQIRHISKSNSPNYYDLYGPLSGMGFQGVFAKRNIGGQLGEEGLAIFFNKNNFYLVQSDVLYFQDKTGRLALGVTLRSPQGYILKVITTHIALPHPSIQQSINQIQTLSQWGYLNDSKFPCILTGDFNLDSDVPLHYNIMKKLQQRFNDAHFIRKCLKPTFSLNIIGANTTGMIPQLMGTKIDYIFVSKQNIKVKSAQIIGQIKDLPTINEPSDHLPVSATLNLYFKQGKLFIDDIIKLKSLFLQVRQRDYQNDPKFKQFLDLFWLLPNSIKNQIYSLTYIKAVKLELYEQNYQFGKIAFTNNTYHIETILDQDGKRKNITYEIIKHDLIPREVINQILNIVQQRIIKIPQLLFKLQKIPFQQFLQIFDQLNTETKNLVYGETYKIACQKYLQTNHFDFGKVSFRKIEGWSVSGQIRAQALKKVLLP